MGNPGDKYIKTRHNAGFRVIDKISDKMDIKLKKPAFKRFKIGKAVYRNNKIYLVKPLTYMNRSGEIISNLLKYTKAEISDIIVICDTLDLPPGKLRLKRSGSGAGQKGLESIIKTIKTNNIARIFIGIGRPLSKNNIINYVLKKPKKDDAYLLEQAMEKAAESILKLTVNSIESVMNEIN